jgi:hypothetical protein
MLYKMLRWKLNNSGNPFGWEVQQWDTCPGDISPGLGVVSSFHSRVIVRHEFRSWREEHNHWDGEYTIPWGGIIPDTLFPSLRWRLTLDGSQFREQQKRRDRILCQWFLFFPLAVLSHSHVWSVENMVSPYFLLYRTCSSHSSLSLTHPHGSTIYVVLFTCATDDGCPLLIFTSFPFHHRLNVTFLTLTWHSWHSRDILDTLELKIGMTRQKRFFHECQNYHESDKPFKINMHHVSLRQSVEETRLGKEKGEGGTDESERSGGETVWTSRWE